MFKSMRRTKQQLSDEKSIEILKKCTNGILSLISPNGYPYGVPLNYVYNEGKLYFHCAKNGHKVDAILLNDKVCFTVVDKDDVIPEKLTSDYSSVIVFGKARIIKDEDEKLKTLLILSNKYCAEYQENIQREVNINLRNLIMVEISIEHFTGKESMESVKRNK